MTFQASVSLAMGFGVVGELFLDGPLRAQPAILDSADADNNVIGRAFTLTEAAAAGAAIKVEAGGTGVFCGILANPKAYASYGTAAGGPLAPTLTLANETIVELVTETPGLIVSCGAANVGDWIEFLNADGVLNAISPGASPSASSTIIAGARVERYDVTSGLAVISLGTPSTVEVSA